MDIPPFILEGKIREFYVGAPFRKERGKWIESIDAHPDGNLRLYQCNIDGYRMNIGVTEEKTVQYIVFHEHDQQTPFSFTIDDVTIDYSFYPKETGMWHIQTYQPI